MTSLLFRKIITTIIAAESGDFKRDYFRFHLLLGGGAIGGRVLSAIVLNIFGDWIDRIDSLFLLRDVVFVGNDTFYDGMDWCLIISLA